MFYRTEPFVFHEKLKSEWQAIRDEFLGAFDESHAHLWPQSFVFTNEWKLLPLVDHGRMVQHGVPELDDELARNQKNFPHTTRVVSEFPGLVTAGFSRLAPGSRIHPHKGIEHSVLRCHLGVIVPEGCTLHVHGVQKQWEDQCVWLFDDTYSHEVWSDADDFRVVLIMDFNKADLEKAAGIQLSEIEIPRTAEEVERGEELERRQVEWQEKYAEQEPEPDWDKIFDYDVDES